LCMGFMFLFRKSEYLTDKRGKGKLVHGECCTLLSDNVLLWWGTTSYPSTSRFLPFTPPDYISIYLPRTKGDPYGKGATRFFPRLVGGQFCLVTVIYIYVAETRRLTPGRLFLFGT
jgi:hypothetical protein